jgi:hypothetical protein
VTLRATFGYLPEGRATLEKLPCEIPEENMRTMMKTAKSLAKC